MKKIKQVRDGETVKLRKSNRAVSYTVEMKTKFGVIVTSTKSTKSKLLDSNILVYVK